MLLKKYKRPGLVPDPGWGVGDMKVFLEVMLEQN